MSMETIMWIVAGIVYLAAAVLYTRKKINDILRDQENAIAATQRNGKIRYISNYKQNRGYRTPSHSYHSPSLSR